MAGTLVVVLAGCDTGPGETTPAPTTALATTTTAATTTQAPLRAAEAIGVSFPAEGTELVGTLRLPATAGPAPAVVFIHGSGPVDRDSRIPGQVGMGFGFEVAVFAELADGLQASGFAVLTYDKRSCGPFNGCATNGYSIPADDLTIDTFIADASAAVDWLRQRGEVDPEHVSIVGHSQGAQFVIPMLAADPEIDRGVMIAGPFQPIDQTIESQRDFVVDLLEQLGSSREDALASPAVVPITDLVTGLENIRSGSNQPVEGVSAEFWNSWFDLTDRTQQLASQVRQPVLVVNGELDWNVPATEAEAWQMFFDQEGVNAELVVLPCATHALNCLAESDVAALTPGDIGRGVVAEAIEQLAAFLEP